MKPFFGEKRPNNYWWFVKGTEVWTGVVMIVLMAIAYILAQPWFRRNKLNLPKTIKKLTGFNAFWYSHHLFVIVYILLLVHGYYLYFSKEWHKKTVSIWNSCSNLAMEKKILRYRFPKILFSNFVCATLSQTWMYLAVPILLYACERLIRGFRSSYKTVRILKVLLIFTDTLFSWWCSSLWNYSEMNACYMFSS